MIRRLCRGLWRFLKYERFDVYLSERWVRQYRQTDRA